MTGPDNPPEMPPNASLGLDAPVAQVMIDALPVFGTWQEEWRAEIPSPPPVLYHYTDVESLRSILTNRSLWASNAAFLNDQSELLHTLLLLKTILDDEVTIPASVDDQSPERKGDNVMRLVIDRFYEFFEVYVVCFCASRDLLSQWRAYGTDGGYAIGFSGEGLAEVARGQLSLHPAVYDETLQRDRLVELARRWRALFASQDAWGDEPMTTRATGLLFAGCVSFQATAFKSKKFEEEEEWRLVYRKIRAIPDDGLALNVRFRSRNGMLLPYVSIGKSDTSPETLLDLTEIVMGPTRFPNQAGFATEQFLQSLGYPPFSIPVNESAIPLRAW